MKEQQLEIDAIQQDCDRLEARVENALKKQGEATQVMSETENRRNGESGKLADGLIRRFADSPFRIIPGTYAMYR